MAQVRVFELAKELNMPAKQLLTKLRKAGIRASGNFSELSIDQANAVRNLTKNEESSFITKSKKENLFSDKNINNKINEGSDDKKEKSEKKEFDLITVSKKSIIEDINLEVTPKIRVRRKKDKILPSESSEKKNNKEIEDLTSEQKLNYKELKSGKDDNQNLNSN